jgi:Gamma-glutamyl cyclotransferase, AIG2-like
VIALFSYGTLQQREVQLATYGRLLQGTPDVLTGYRLAPLAISDPRVVAVSGKAVHTIARPTGDPADRISGTLFELTEAELGASDGYEVDAYSRVEVMLETGRMAFVYVGPPVVG